MNTLLLISIVLLLVYARPGKSRVRAYARGGLATEPGRSARRQARIWTAYHEAGHAVVGQDQGARVDSCRVVSPYRGITMLEWPDRLDPDEVEHRDVVAALAGDLAERKAGGPGGECGHTGGQLRKRLRGTGRSYGQCKRQARTLVDRNWHDIERLAATL